MGKCDDIMTSWWSYDGLEDWTMYSEYSDAPPYTDVSGNEAGLPADPFTCVYNPCSPYLSVPTQIYNVDPAFRGCMPGISGFFDPSYFLTPGGHGGLQAFTTTSTSSSSSSKSTSSSSVNSGQPAPGAQPDPDIAAKTTTTAPPSTSSTQDADPNQGGYPNNGDPPAATKTCTKDTADPSLPADPGNPPAEVKTTTDSNTPADPPIPASPADPLSQQTVPHTTQPLTIIATFSTQVITQDSASNFIFDGTTIAVGKSAVNIGETTYSLATSGNALVINGTTSFLPTQSLIDPGWSMNTAAANGALFAMIGTTSIVPGSPAAVVGGTTYSAPSSVPALIVDGTTEYLVADQTLVAGGPPITISGTMVSLEAGGQRVVVGSSTEAIASFLSQNSGLVGVQTTSQGIGGIIASLGGFTTPEISAAPTDGYVGPIVSGTSAGDGYNGTMFLGAASNTILLNTWSKILLIASGIVVVLL